MPAGTGGKPCQRLKQPQPHQLQQAAPTAGAATPAAQPAQGVQSRFKAHRHEGHAHFLAGGRHAGQHPVHLQRSGVSQAGATGRPIIDSTFHPPPFIACGHCCALPRGDCQSWLTPQQQPSLPDPSAAMYEVSCTASPACTAGPAGAHLHAVRELKDELVHDCVLHQNHLTSVPLQYH